jgi:hypothetical protein
MSAYVSRQRPQRRRKTALLHTSAYVSRRQHMSAYVSIRLQTSADSVHKGIERQLFCIRQHTSAYVSIRQHTSAHVSIRQSSKGRLSFQATVVSVNI